MANREALAEIKFPLMEKPTTPANQKEIYSDIFEIQNVLRLMLIHLVEEAPMDGKKYARQDGTWVEIP
jgi:ribosomal protein L2